jgi:Ca2+-binding RTX toxin-like protein
MRRLLSSALLVAIGCGAIQAATGAIYRGGAGPDRLTGTALADELYGQGGNDQLDGRGAGDFLDGGPGRDRLSGSAGNDRLASSGDGRDRSDGPGVAGAQ